MSHILIIKTRNNADEVDAMFRSIVDVLTADGDTFDEVTIPTEKELPISLNLFTEGQAYEAVILVGYVTQSQVELAKIHYKQIVGSIYDFSNYFGVITGCCVAYAVDNKPTKQDIEGFAHQIASSVSNMLRTVRHVNSMENSKYVGSSKHN